MSAGFPTNQLPLEFQQEHGTIDLDNDDVKPDIDGHGGVEDEDLALNGIERGVWLCKIPKFLMEKWSRVSQEGVELGRIRIYDELDAEGHNKVALFLNADEGVEQKPQPVASSSGKPDVKGKGAAKPSLAQRAAALANGGGTSDVPTEYKVTMTNRASKNLYVFGEREEEDEESGEVGHRRKRRVTSMLGTVHHECSLTPSLSASYSTIMRERLRRAAEPKRKLKVLDVDQATANRMASGVGAAGVKGRVSTFNTKKPTAAKGGSGTRYVRLPRNELLDLVFAQFATAPYWSLKALQEHVEQPQTYLREILSDVGHLIPRGPYAGMWTLKEEFKGDGGRAKADTGDGVGGGQPGPDMKPDVQAGDSKNDDDDDDEMEIVE